MPGHIDSSGPVDPADDLQWVIDLRRGAESSGGNRQVLGRIRPAYLGAVEADPQGKAACRGVLTGGVYAFFLESRDIRRDAVFQLVSQIIPAATVEHAEQYNTAAAIFQKSSASCCVFGGA